MQREDELNINVHTYNLQYTLLSSDVSIRVPIPDCAFGSKYHFTSIASFAKCLLNYPGSRLGRVLLVRGEVKYEVVAISCANLASTSDK